MTRLRNSSSPAEAGGSNESLIIPVNLDASAPFLKEPNRGVISDGKIRIQSLFWKPSTTKFSF